MIMTMPQQSIRQLLAQASARLQPSSATPRLDAELLLAHVLGWPRARLLAEGTHTPDVAQVAAYEALVERRANLEPVAYLTGEREFYGLLFHVDGRVLVPRPETELLIDVALSIIHRRDTHIHHKGTKGTKDSFAEDPTRLRVDSKNLGALSVLGGETLTIADIGTGSGAIAVALALHVPQAQVYATDISAEALAVALANVARHGLHQRVTLLHGDLCEALPKPVDLLVSNPPYTVLAEVDEGVRRHEPHLALDGGEPQGIALYRRLLGQAPRYLRPGGAVVLEIGSWQGETVLALARESFPGAEVTLHRDIAGHDRVIAVQAPARSNASRKQGDGASLVHAGDDGG
jgi:release factor glutamine methyltransferase